MSDTTEAQLNVVFSKSTDFVDIRALRDIVAPNDSRDAAKLIETKKLRDVRTQLESNGVVAVRASSNGKFEVHVDLALEYILYRNKDLKQFVTSIRNNRPGGIRGVLESTPGLFERVKTVFGDNGIRHVRLEGKFYFAAPDLARLVLWDSERKTPSIKNAARDVHLAAVKDTLLAGELLRTFQFGYGNDTPILDIRGAARLWMCLPGARASAFRTTLADTWIRVFGGDESLIEEIRRNRQIQEGLPQNHPGRAFAEAVKEGQSKRPSTEEHHTTKRPRKALVDITNTVQPVAVLHPIVGPGPSSRPGQKKFRSLVIARVQFNGGIRCECTGTKRDLDAAHIVPYCRGDGKYSHGTWATNGLLLHRAIHTVWDAGLVKLTPNPPFEWVDVDENGIEAMYGGLSTWIVTQLRHNGLRGDILDGMTSEDQKIFIDNIKTRFER